MLVFAVFGTRRNGTRPNFFRARVLSRKSFPGFLSTPCSVPVPLLLPLLPVLPTLLLQRPSLPDDLFPFGRSVAFSRTALLGFAGLDFDGVGLSTKESSNWNFVLSNKSCFPLFKIWSSVYLFFDPNRLKFLHLVSYFFIPWYLESPP